MENTSFPEVHPDLDLPVVSKTKPFNKFKEIDELKDLKMNYYKNHYDFHIRELRKEEGLGLALKINNDRLVVNVVGSQLMDDVLTGRCDTIDFEDYMKHRKRIKISELKKLQENITENTF